jgi:hypothetical protein
VHQPIFKTHTYTQTAAIGVAPVAAAHYAAAPIAAAHYAGAPIAIAK